MSDTASAPAKRGRKPAADAEKPAEKGEAKKREHKKVESAENGDDGVVTAKRGRGRPKGTTKKAAEKPKAKSTGGKRGRPKKTETNNKEDSEDEDKEKSNTEEEEAEDEDDD